VTKSLLKLQIKLVSLCCLLGQETFCIENVHIIFGGVTLLFEDLEYEMPFTLYCYNKLS